MADGDSTWNLLAPLELEIDGYSLDRLEQKLSEQFTRVTTLVRLSGRGMEGIGEEVTYDPENQLFFQRAGAVHELVGEHTLASFSELLDGLELFGDEPGLPAYRDYRRWAFESAALDLALLQAGKPLGDVLKRQPRPLRYVVSMRLSGSEDGQPEQPDRLLDILDRYPGTRFKLDPTATWSDELIVALAETGAVDSLDLKGHYKGTPVDVDTDAELYRRVTTAFPGSWIEDPDLSDPAAAGVLELHHDRITWDAPIHSVADIEALPFKPRTVNIKPSRFGSLARLCAAYDYCAANDIGAYGGGQTELGVGRDHIQYLAAIFHPDGPNDTAPREFNLPKVPNGLPASPIDLPVAVSGLRFA